MKPSIQKKIKTASVFASLAFVILAFGFGCGVGFESVGFLDQGSVVIEPQPPVDQGDNGDLVIVSGVRTAAVVNAIAYLESLVAMAGVQPSAATIAAFNANKDNLPDTNSVMNISAPGLLAYTSVGSELCKDLVDSEIPIGVANRRFFQFDLSGGAAVVTDAVIANMTRRLARNFWQRNETAEELSAINAAVREMMAAAQLANSGSVANKAALFTCTAMISSLSAIEI
jgi:hypothetical protein